MNTGGACLLRAPTSLTVSQSYLWLYLVRSPSIRMIPTCTGLKILD